MGLYPQLLLLCHVSIKIYLVLSHLYTHAFICVHMCMCAFAHYIVWCVHTQGQSQKYTYKCSLNVYIGTGLYLTWKHFSMEFLSNFNYHQEEGDTSVLSSPRCVGLPLCWKAFSENTTARRIPLHDWWAWVASTGVTEQYNIYIVRNCFMPSTFIC